MPIPIHCALSEPARRPGRQPFPNSQVPWAHRLGFLEEFFRTTTLQHSPLHFAERASIRSGKHLQMQEVTMVHAAFMPQHPPWQPCFAFCANSVSVP